MKYFQYIAEHYDGEGKKKACYSFKGTHDHTVSFVDWAKRRLEGGGRVEIQKLERK